MKKVKKELKKLIAVKLLNWSFTVMPDCRFKAKLANLISKELPEGIDK